MLNIILALFLIFSRIPLTAFQFLLLICLIEIETGVFIGDYYWSIIVFFYLLFRWMWRQFLNAPVVQSG